MNTPRFQSVRLLALALLCVVGSAQAGQGLLVEWYNTLRFQGAPIVVSDGSGPTSPANLPNIDTNTASRVPGGAATNISVRWTGQILPPVTGSYVFGINSDDGSRLFVNGKLVVSGDLAQAPNTNNWIDQGVGTVRRGSINLTANVPASIRVEFYQGGGGAGMFTLWDPPDVGGTFAEVNIPINVLSPAPTTLQGGGLLASSPAPVALTALPTPINLTTDGTIDWIQWGIGSKIGKNRKATGKEFINDFANQGTGGNRNDPFPDGLNFAATTGAKTFSWTDGATSGNVVNAVASTTTNTCISQGNNAGDGFEVTAPADTTPRRLRVYAKSLGQTLSIEASISDFSAAPIVQTMAANSEQVFTFVYRASKPGQMITVRSVVSGGTAGPSILYAATVANPVPTATPQSLTLNEDQVSFPITLTGTDPEQQALTFAVTVPPLNGTLSGTAPNLFYTPNPNYSGPDSFSFTATDPTNLSGSGTISLTVTPQPDGPPTLVNDTATTPDNVPVTVNVLANDTIIDRPFTVTLVGQPANGIAILNPDNTITYRGNLSFVGTDVVTYRVTDTIFGQTATATLTITIPPIPPTITSTLSVNAVQGLLFTYKITATGTLPITYTAAPLPSGLTLVGDTIQGFIQAGSYAVTLSATNQAASDIRTLIINAIIQTPNVDTDGDGFPDELEIAVGSSPVDPNSTPFTVLRNGVGAIPPGIPPPGTIAVAKPFFVSNLGIKLDFRSATLTRDAVSFKGTLPVPSTFSSSIQAVAASVGGVTVSGVLDTRGSYTSANKRVKVKIGKTRTSLAGANAPISVSTRGVFAGAFTDEGYSNVNASKAQSKVVLFVIAGTEYFTATVNTDYSAVAGQKGSAKSSKR